MCGCPSPPSPTHPFLPPTLTPLLHTGNSQDEHMFDSTKEQSSLDETDCMQDPAHPLPSQDWPEPRHRKMESKRKQLERQAELSKVAGQGQQTPQFLTSPRPQRLEPVGSGEAERLLEFANIATGPQSPLLSRKHYDWDKDRLAGSERTEGSATDVGSHSFPSCTAITATVTSTTATSLPVDSDSKNLRSPSPQTHTAVWQCFSKGTKVRFSLEDSSAWYPVERLAMLILQGKGPMVPHDLKQPVALRLVSRQKVEEREDEVELGFESEGSLRSHLTASCVLHHPFNVRKKGWASCDTSRTHEVYGLTGSPLEINDVCLPLLHSKQPVTAKDSEGSEVNRLEYSSVVALSNMAQKRSQESATGHQPHPAPNGQEVPKAKRPMNNFILWSRTKRTELIHKFPKTSNRNISGMLSKEWRKLSEQEKTRLHEEAKVKAELQKQQHPNCWKRKNRDH